VIRCCGAGVEGRSMRCWLLPKTTLKSNVKQHNVHDIAMIVLKSLQIGCDELHSSQNCQ